MLSKESACLCRIAEAVERIEMNIGLFLSLSSGGGAGGTTSGEAEIQSGIESSSTSAFWLPTDTSAEMWQDEPRTVAVAAGDSPAYWDSRYGTEVAQSDGTFINGGGLRLADETQFVSLRGTPTFTADDFYIALVLRNVSDKDFVTVTRSGIGNIGIAQSNTDSPISNMGASAKAFVDNVEKTTRTTFKSASVGAPAKLLEFTNLDLSGGTIFQIGGFSAALSLVSDVVDLLMMPMPDASSRASIQSYLAGRNGITL